MPLWASATPPTGFIERQGSSLVLAGQPYRFTGINVYNANSDGSCGPAFGSGPAFGEALDMIGSGGKVVRAWFFQSMATVNGQRDWSAFDHTLSVAASHGVRVIPTLGNQWEDCEPVAGYKDHTWYGGGYTQPDPGGTVSYRDFVQEIVTRYRDDPTVAFWQLMNEAEVKPSATSGSCSPGAATLLHDFAEDVSGLVKSIDPNHLVSLGAIGSGQCGAQDTQYRDLHAIPTIDLCEFHDYDPTALIPGDQYNGLQVRFDQCAQLNKPLFVGELGMTPTQAGGGLLQRADAFRAKLQAQFDAGSVGELLWAWYEDAPVSLASLDIHRSDPALRVLAAALNPGIRSIGAGNWSSCAVSAAGGAKCWGANFMASLGDHTMIQRNRPVDVIDLPSGVAAIDGGNSHTCALVGGRVKCWGENNGGQLGQGTTFTHSPSPLDVVGVSDARAVTASSAHACALLAGGSAKCWGSSGSGQLGGGTPIGSGVYGPQTVLAPEPLQQIAAGNSHSCAITVDGGAMCWGSNQAGQVGDGDRFQTSPRSSPVDVVGLSSGVLQIAPGGAHTCALTTTGVKCWGLRHAGQLGDGQISQNSIAYEPVDVIGEPDGLQAIASGAHHTCVITATGGLLCWGDNDYGQLGNGSQSDSAVPVPVTGMSSDVIQVVGGERHTCALKDDGTVWCWGDGQYGQVGNRSTAGSSVPVQVDFTVPPMYPLSVTMAGTGTGLVNSGAYELVCTHGTCSVDFDEDTVVTLTATPDSGFVFGGWGGEGCSGTGTCVVTMSQARFVTATFSARPPDAPTSVAAVAGNGQATVSWNAPADDGGSAITRYIVTTSPADVPPFIVDPPVTHATITGLTNCLDYTFTVRAVNVAGTGAASMPPEPPAPDPSAVTPSTTITVGVGEDANGVLYTPPAVRFATDLCVRLTWTFTSTNTRNHTVRESSASLQGLGPSSAPLFDSGLVAAGGSFGPYLFRGATFYQYRSTATGDSNSPSRYGSVTMPIVTSPALGTRTTPFTVQWAKAPMSGYGFAVRYQFKPENQTNWGSTWTAWNNPARTDHVWTGTSATFTPSEDNANQNKQGAYRFQARIKNLATGKMGGWSLVTTPACLCQVTITQVAGAVVNDANNNGADDSEAGLAGAQVKLYRDDGDLIFEPGAGDPQIGSTYTTTADGLWGFNGLPTATYFVAETNPPGYVSTNAIPGSGSGTTSAKVHNDLVRIVIATNGATNSGTKFLDH
jgi:alpha-tubulin suppressor-like RCC1 family protein